jgi:bacteriorhodopsin
LGSSPHFVSFCQKIAVVGWLMSLGFSGQAAKMKYLFAAAMTMALLTGPAYAQMSMGADKTPLQLKYEREDKERAENEKAYNTTMKRLKTQAPAKTSSDPWKIVRPAASESTGKH